MFFRAAVRIAGFHPKAVFWRTHSGACYSLIGSSNLSDAGWNTNYEANVFQKLSARQFETVRAWIEQISQLSEPITKDWINNYEEAPSRSGRRAKANDASQQFISQIALPTFPGQTAVIRKRRNKKKKFDEIRARLVSGIHRCAAGRMSNKKFYDFLQDTWGSHPSRVQGWGWQVTGQRSDFRALCRGLVAIINSGPEGRDYEIVRVIDDLAKRGVPTRRSLLSELLCLLFPDRYPILNKPVANYVRSFVKAPRGSSEGEHYLHLTLSLRAALQDNPRYPAKNLLELDGMIWTFQDSMAS